MGINETVRNCFTTSCVARQSEKRRNVYKNIIVNNSHAIKTCSAHRAIQKKLKLNTIKQRRSALKKYRRRGKGQFFDGNYQQRSQNFNCATEFL